MMENRYAERLRIVADLAASVAEEAQCLLSLCTEEKPWPEMGTKRSGAFRRRTMDLTRALADYRRT